MTKVIQMAKFVLEKKKKKKDIVGKEENAGYQHFLLFPQCIQKAFSLGSVKVGKELTHSHMTKFFYQTKLKLKFADNKLNVSK